MYNAPLGTRNNPTLRRQVTEAMERWLVAIPMQEALKIDKTNLH